MFKIRNGTYWTARRYTKKIAPETIEHMKLECSRWQALRADILAQYINIYRCQEQKLGKGYKERQEKDIGWLDEHENRAQVATKPPLLSASISMRLVGKLLREELKISSTRIRKDPDSKFLNAISLPRYLMLNSIRLAPIPPNQCPPGTETLFWLIVIKETALSTT
ncbi:hypothetical protein BB561_006288 [Smittium simulii]|uniref:Uncharacterized protein n=1 Tax=Smittium simulii TaxID=133385 RepID=A0A2T9Y5H0_9FUNG|nr:hypothetical protein BB561_006288 [Smittium simulii]